MSFKGTDETLGKTVTNHTNTKRYIQLTLSRKGLVHTSKI